MSQRPHDKLENLLPGLVKRSAFLGLFCGAYKDITIFISPTGEKRAPTWGKCECEQVKDWENFYFKELVSLGLISPVQSAYGEAKGMLEKGWMWEKWTMVLTDLAFEVYKEWRGTA